MFVHLKKSSMARRAEISRTEKPWFGHACMKKPPKEMKEDPTSSCSLSWSMPRFDPHNKTSDSLLFISSTQLQVRVTTVLAKVPTSP